MKALVIFFALSGCAWPSKTHHWCAPLVKFNHEKQAAYTGLRCAW